MCLRQRFGLPSRFVCVRVPRRLLLPGHSGRAQVLQRQPIGRGIRQTDAGKKRIRCTPPTFNNRHSFHFPQCLCRISRCWVYSEHNVHWVEKNVRKINYEFMLRTCSWARIRWKFKLIALGRVCMRCELLCYCLTVFHVMISMRYCIKGLRFRRIHGRGLLPECGTTDSSGTTHASLVHASSHFGPARYFTVLNH